MPGFFAIRMRRGAKLLGGLLAPTLLSVAGAGPAAEPAPPGPPAAAVTLGTPAAPQALDLAACRRIALDRQPAVVAARASLAAAAARASAADNLHVPSFLARDLPIRRKQAALGVVIAEAGVAKASADTLYGVTYSYLSALYARTQRKLAEEKYDDLKDFEERVREGVALPGQPRTSERDVDKVGIRALLARARLQEAIQGEQRALSALREAMGVGPDCPPPLFPADWFDADPPVDLHQVLGAALERRAELIQAANVAEVSRYEVSAQDARRLPTARTFAANSDLHAQPIPPGIYEEIYRPAGVGPEMPTLMAGSRCDRVEQARAYSARADAVVDKTRNLIVLEAEQAYYRWLEARNKEQEYQRAASRADKRFTEVRSAWRRMLRRPTVDDYLTFGQLATDARVQANLARYQKLLALAGLERVTGGAFCPGFETWAPAAPRAGDR